MCCQPKEPDLCFELLGFDILLDHNLKPWLLEVNHLPSFNTDTKVDEDIKANMVRDLFQILSLGIQKRRIVEREMKEEKKL